MYFFCIFCKPTSVSLNKCNVIPPKRISRILRGRLLLLMLLLVLILLLVLMLVLVLVLILVLARRRVSGRRLVVTLVVKVVQQLAVKVRVRYRFIGPLVN